MRTSGWSGWLQVAAAAAVVAVAAVYVGLGAAHPWDFETYYYAASAARAGLDPYSISSLSAAAGRPVTLPFLYPPVTLLLFAPFTYVPLAWAGLLWLGLKLAITGLLIRLWVRYFLADVRPALVVIVAALGFDLALLWDLRTGNASLLEQGLLWLGFSAHVRGKTARAAALIALAACFKIYPILFLPVLLSGDGRGKIRVIGVALLAFTCAVSLPLFGRGAWAAGLPAGLFHEALPPGADPSSLTVIRWCLAHVQGSRPVPGSIATAVHLAYVVVFLILSAPLIKRALRGGSPVEGVCVAVLLWLLLVPRVMVYSYVAAVVPSLYALHRMFRDVRWKVAASGALTFGGMVRLLPGAAPAWIGVDSFLSVLAIWILWALRRDIWPSHYTEPLAGRASRR